MEDNTRPGEAAATPAGLSSGVSRAQQRYLGLLPPLRARPDAEAQAIEHIAFADSARRSLLQQLYASGTLRGGPLFGEREAGTVTVHFAVPGGYACWSRDVRPDPLDTDERYLLGWSDCLARLYGERVQWVGNWIAYPHSQLASVEDDMSWLREGLETDLFNEDCFLLSVGWQQGRLAGRAYGFERALRQLLPFSHDLEQP